MFNGSNIKLAKIKQFISLAIAYTLLIGIFSLSLQHQWPLELSAQNSIPFLPSDNNTTITPKPHQPIDSSSAMQEPGTLTVKQVILDTDRLLPNSKFRITPNPFTLKGSLIIEDNNETMDSDLTKGVILLKGVKFSPYLINETSSAGFGPVLLKTRITVHQTNPNPVAIVENRKLGMPFNGAATVTAPFLNDSSLRTFVANGATLGGTVPIKKVDQLPSGFIVSTEKPPAGMFVSNMTTTTLEYDVEELDRYFENYFAVDCHTFVVTIDYPKDMTTPVVYDVNLENDEVKRYKVQPVVEKGSANKRNRNLARWTKRDIIQGQSFKFEW